MAKLAKLVVAFVAVARLALADVDGDGIEDGLDNCPYAANVGQEDAGGLLTLLPEGIGDVCQCGDISDDGLPDVLDVSLYRRALQSLGPLLPAPQKCDVAPPAGACDADDVARFRSALAGSPPALEQLCAPAQPPVAVCGNGLLEPGESCDGADLGGLTCQELGFIGGSLVCTPSCAFDLSACIPAGQPGDACGSSTQCDAGLTCSDSVCCTSLCTGTCSACDNLGSLGQCTANAIGQDPDGECGAQSCVGYYDGWVGDSCRRKADVSASVAGCDGAGGCQTQTQVCTAQAEPGPVTTTCDSVCQNPNLATCTGTTAGACTDVDQGSQSCGVGQCLRLASICSNGAPQACTPGTPLTETCNDIDDNCDGIVDNGAFGDGFEPNPACGSAQTLATVGSDQTQSVGSATIYGSGDVDYYLIPATETDISCGCGAFSFDEDYAMRVTLSVPAGAGSYEICMNTNSCGFPAGNCFNVAAGASLTLSQFLDGACGPGQTDSYSVYVRVSGSASPGFECRPYTLTYTFDAGLCR